MSAVGDVDQVWGGPRGRARLGYRSHNLKRKNNCNMGDLVMGVSLTHC